jgi:hypothetical protein
VPCFALLGVQPDACDSAVYVDPLHPTTIVHDLIADAAYDRVINGRDIAVPEPSMPALLLIPVALLAVLQLRARLSAISSCETGS